MIPFDYDRAAAHYDRHRRGDGPYLDTLVALHAGAPIPRALELGAGTGNNTAPFHARTHCPLTALEPSREMARQACAKNVPGAWVRADAEAMPFPRDVFGFIFAVYVLHHIHPLDTLMRECARVVRPGGRAAFITAPHEFIREHPLNAYFPSFAATDLARFQSVEEIQEAFRNAGFRATASLPHAAPPKPMDAEFLRRVEGKYISTLALLPPEEFSAGLERLRSDIARHGILETPVIWKSVVVWGEL